MKKWIKISLYIVFIGLVITFFILKDKEEKKLEEKPMDFNINREVKKEKSEEEEEKELSLEEQEIIEYSIDVFFEGYDYLLELEKNIKEADLASGNEFKDILTQKGVLFEPEIPEDWNEEIIKDDEYIVADNFKRINMLDEIYDEWSKKHPVPDEVKKEIYLLHAKLNILSDRRDYHNALYYFTDEAVKMLGPIYANLINDENLYERYTLTYFEFYNEDEKLASAFNFKESTWREEEVKDMNIYHYYTIYKKVDGEWKIHYEMPILTGEQILNFKILNDL